VNKIRSALTSVRGKTVIGFVVIILLVLVMVIVSFHQLSQVRAASNQVVPGTQQIKDVQEFALTMSELESNLDRFFVTEGADLEENIQDEMANLEEIVTELQSNPTETTEETVNQLALATNNLNASIQDFLVSDRSSWSPNEFNRTVIHIYQQIDDVNLIVQQLSAETLAHLDGVSQFQQSIIDNINQQFLLVGTAVVIIAIIAAVIIIRTLRPIGTLTEVSQDIAEGNLDREAPVESNDEIGQLAVAFNTMTGRVRDLVDNLEQRVDARTQDLNLAANIGRQISQARDLDDVLNNAATSVKNQFDLYQVQIYLVDRSGNNLVLRASDGFAGSRILKTGHQLPIDEYSLNGSAAYNKQAVIVSDTQQDAHFRPHPLLPDTRSEMVVPIMLEDDVMGVMDLQSKEANSLTEDVLPAFTVLAGQLAIAIMNARQNRTVQQNQRLMRTIIDASPDWIFVKDQNHRYQLVNEAYAKTFHMTPEQVVGKDDLELGFPEDVVKGNRAKGIRGFWTDDQGVMASKKTKHVPEEPGEVDGKPVVLQTVKAPLMDSEGIVTGIVGFVHDITSRKQAEQTNAKRADELQAVAELSTAVSATEDPQQLLQAVVDLTKDRFELYHAHVYLLDESGQNLVLTAGAGDVGAKMIAQEISLPLRQEQSLVTRAARGKKGVIVNDVTAESGFLPNPLLPNTRSEMAVPMIVGNEVIGVLDVQAEITERFSEQDIQIQTTLAAQTAIALQNAWQHQKTEEALQTANTFRRLVEGSGQGIGIVNMQGTASYANSALQQLIGKDATEIIGNPMFPLYPSDIQDRLQQEVIPTVVEQGQWQGNLRILNEDTEVPTFESYFLIRDDEGNPTQIAAIISDITEQKETEERIRANQTLMRTIIDNISDWIILKSLDHRFLLVNQSFADAKHLSIDEIIGKNDIEIGENKDTVMGNPESEYLGFWGEDKQVTDNGIEQFHEGEAVDLSGEARYKTTRKIPLKDENGDVTGLMVFVQDITEMKRVQEKQALLAQEMQEQLAQMNALQRAMTHEGWESFLSSQNKDGAGFAFTGETVQSFDGTTIQEAIGDVNLNLDDVTEISYDEAKTAVAMPLELHGESIGVIGARSANGDPINAEQQALLATLTAQVAESLDRARLFEETETARSQTEALFAGSENVVRSTSLDGILLSLVQATALKNMHRASLLFFDQPWQDTPPESISVAATWRVDDSITSVDVGTTYPFNMFPGTQFLDRKEPSVIDDVLTNPRIDENAKQLSFEGLGMRSVIIVPLVAGDQWIGFALGLSANVHHMNESDIRQITSLAGQAATVAQSQRLYEEAATRAEREQILRQVSDRVYAAPDAETVLRTAAREIGQALGLETFVYLDFEDTEEAIPVNGDAD